MAWLRPAGPPLALPLLALLLAAPAAHAQEARPSDAWIATRTLAPGEMVQTTDVELRPLDQKMFGLFGIDQSPAGLEAKHRILSGRPVFDRDVGRHAVIKANAPVRVLWQATGIQMQLDGKALQDGVVGEQIRVLNPQSSRTLRGIVQADGSVAIGNTETFVSGAAP